MCGIKRSDHAGKPLIRLALVISYDAVAGLNVTPETVETMNVLMIKIGIVSLVMLLMHSNNVCFAKKHKKGSGSFEVEEEPESEPVPCTLPLYDWIPSPHMTGLYTEDECMVACEPDCFANVPDIRNLAGSMSGQCVLQPGKTSDSDEMLAACQCCIAL